MPRWSEARPYKVWVFSTFCDSLCGNVWWIVPVETLHARSLHLNARFYVLKPLSFRMQQFADGLEKGQGGIGTGRVSHWQPVIVSDIDSHGQTLAPAREPDLA